MLAGAAVVGALEQQVLEEVRRARPARRARRATRRRPRSRPPPTAASGMRSVTTRRPLASVGQLDASGPVRSTGCRADRPPRRRAAATAAAARRHGRRRRRRGRRRGRRSAGPRSPNSVRTSSSKASSNETYSRSPPAPRPALAAGARPPRSPRRSRAAAVAIAAAAAGLAAGSSPARRQRHLALRVDVVDPDLDLVAEVDARPPPGRCACRRPSLEMWSRPSRPGRMLTNAPNLVMLTTLPV